MRITESAFDIILNPEKDTVIKNYNNRECE